MTRPNPNRHYLKLISRADAQSGYDRVQAIRDRLNGPAAHRRIPESRWETFVCAACVAMVAFLLMVSL